MTIHIRKLCIPTFFFEENQIYLLDVHVQYNPYQRKMLSRFDQSTWPQDLKINKFDQIIPLSNH